jgi:hypothetical protein
MWLQFDAVDDAEAPGSRECHSFDARSSTGLLYLFGGNDQQQRMNAVLTLNTGEQPLRVQGAALSRSRCNGVVVPLRRAPGPPLHCIYSFRGLSGERQPC